MKIAVAGSHGTGKSTFAKGLAEKLSGHYIYDIVREEAAPKGFAVNENTPLVVQLWLMSRQWELERTTPEPWVADKCLYDYLVYGEIIFKDEAVKKVLREVVKENANYDFVFYLPIEFPMELDGLRSENLEFQKEVDRRYKEFLDEFGIKYITLSGSVEERINQALQLIGPVAA